MSQLDDLDRHISEGRLEMNILAMEPNLQLTPTPLIATVNGRSRVQFPFDIVRSVEKLEAI